MNPTFTADAAGTYVAQLIVNDGTQNSAPATVMVTAGSAANLPPVANAGPDQTVAVGQTVTLDGTGSSDPESSALTYSWTFVSVPSGSTATLTNPTTVNPTFVPDVAGAYVVGLVVNDGTFNSANTANVTITAQTTPSTGLDYDIVNFTATSRVTLGSEKAARLHVTVTNVGTVEEAVPVTLVGIQDGVEVYRRTRQVSAPVGKTVTRRFRSYTPTAVGTIEWTVTIEDLVPAHNTATATTTVVQSHGEQEREGEGESSEMED